MSVPLAKRWRSTFFVREVDGYRLSVWRLVEPTLHVWRWKLELHGERLESGARPDEKAAKLAARRAMERHAKGWESKR